MIQVICFGALSLLLIGSLTFPCTKPSPSEFSLQKSLGTREKFLARSGRRSSSEHSHPACCQRILAQNNHFLAAPQRFAS
jgi:hypothetical protein